MRIFLAEVLLPTQVAVIVLNSREMRDPCVVSALWAGGPQMSVPSPSREWTLQGLSPVAPASLRSGMPIYSGAALCLVLVAGATGQRYLRGWLGCHL